MKAFNESPHVNKGSSLSRKNVKSSLNEERRKSTFPIAGMSAGLLKNKGQVKSQSKGKQSVNIEPKINVKVNEFES